MTNLALSIHSNASRLLLAAALVLSGTSCGGSQPPSKAPASNVTSANDKYESSRGSATEALEGGGSVGAEYGGMDQNTVARVFDGSGAALTKCLEDGSQSMPYLAGSVNFYLEVDTSGRVVHSHVEKSTLGDRDISKCMLDILTKKTWPGPVGGQRGKIQSGLTFSAIPGSDKPNDWEQNRVATVVGELSSDIDACKGSVTGKYFATAYIGTYMQKPDPDTTSVANGEAADAGPKEVGKIIAVDVTPSDKEGAGAVDCLIKVLRSATYDSPGQLPAKVSFLL